MKKTLIITLLIGFAFSITGCAGQLRETAMASQDIADKLNHESVDQLYAIAVKQAMALCKQAVSDAIEDGTYKDMVTFDHNGQKVTMTKLNYLINNSCQTIVSSGWLYNNHTKAQHYSDMAWIYMASRESFLSVLIKDVREALDNGEPEMDVNEK